MLLKFLIILGAVAFFLYKIRKQIGLFILKRGGRYVEKRMRQQAERMREEQTHGETVMRDKDFTVHRKQKNKGHSSGTDGQYVDFEEVND